MRRTLGEIAKLVDGEAIGDAGIIVSGVSGIKEARVGDITFIANSRYAHLMLETQASAVIVSCEFVSTTKKPIIRVKNPSLAFQEIISLFFPSQIQHPKGIHPACAIGKNVSLGKDLALGAYVVVEDDAAIGDRTIVYPGCFIGRRTSIGEDCLIYPNVSIREEAKIGNRVIIHCGTVIGSDGFGFLNIDGSHQKIPQIGTVEIGDDVEIGANVTIDRARFDKTIIGKGTKIDNLVQIAHNVVVGDNSLIIAQAGISGSTVIGNNVTLAGQAGLVGHITVGDGAIIAAQAGVTKSVSANTTVSGYPARPHNEARRVNGYIQRLPELNNTIMGLKKRLDYLEEKLANRPKSDIKIKNKRKTKK